MGDEQRRKEYLEQRQAEASHAAHVRRCELKEKYEGSAYVQRRRLMTKEEKYRDAVEKTAKGIKEYNDFRAGKDTSYEAALKKAHAIGQKALVDNGDK